jgi:hypothetical protein
MVNGRMRVTSNAIFATPGAPGKSANRDEAVKVIDEFQA